MPWLKKEMQIRPSNISGRAPLLAVAAALVLGSGGVATAQPQIAVQHPVNCGDPACNQVSGMVYSCLAFCSGAVKPGGSYTPAKVYYSIWVVDHFDYCGDSTSFTPISGQPGWYSWGSCTNNEDEFRRETGSGSYWMSNSVYRNGVGGEDPMVFLIGGTAYWTPTAP